jgi:hypothetical protein
MIQHKIYIICAHTIFNTLHLTSALFYDMIYELKRNSPRERERDP